MLRWVRACCQKINTAEIKLEGVGDEKEEFISKNRQIENIGTRI